MGSALISELITFNSGWLLSVTFKNALANNQISAIIIKGVFISTDSDKLQCGLIIHKPSPVVKL